MEGLSKAWLVVLIAALAGGLVILFPDLVLKLYGSSDFVSPTVLQIFVAAAIIATANAKEPDRSN